LQIVIVIKVGDCRKTCGNRIQKRASGTGSSNRNLAFR